jgi:hypothetical protein
MKGRMAHHVNDIHAKTRNIEKARLFACGGYSSGNAVGDEGPARI